MSPRLDPLHDDPPGGPVHDEVASSASGSAVSGGSRPTGGGRADGDEPYRETARKVLQRCRGDDAGAPSVDAPEYAVGETFPLLGEPRRVAASATRSENAVVEDHLILATDHGTGTVDVRSSLRELYRRTAGRYFARRVVGYARRMGMDPLQVAVFDSPTRLVDPRDDGPVGFNWRAIMAPPEVVDHAAVAVLAAREYGPDGERFRRLVREHRPDYDYEDWLHPSGLELRLGP